MRLIDGEKFAAVLQELADKHAEGGKTDVAEILLSVKGMLERQETIEAVAVVHGRWINKTNHNRAVVEQRVDCSACGHIFWHTSAMSYNYCPNCGAKMDLE